MQTKTITYFNPYFLDKEGNKIKFLENRLNNQNNVGNISTDFIPLKEKENEKIIKTQMIILPPSKYFSKFYKKSKNKKSKKKKNQNELKIEMFLNKKRNSSSNNSNLSHYSDKSSKTKNTKDENNSALFSAKNLSNYNYLFNFRNNNKNKVKFEYNQKNANKQINSNFNVYLSNKNNNNTLKSKTLFDYFKTTSLRKNDVDNQNKQEIIKNKNISLNSEISISNYSKINNDILLQKLEEQNIIVEQKEKEISKLKISQKENEEIISDLKKYQKDSEKEIRLCRLDISNMVKEISNLKREIKKNG